MRLAYQAIDARGKSVHDVIEAGDARDATERLHRQGLFVTQVREAHGRDTSGGSGSRRRSGGMRTLAIVTRQLHVLLSTGTPIADALDAMSRQVRDAGWQATLKSVRKSVEEGKTLAEALREHPRWFDEVYTSLIEAGESSGKLATMLERLANLTHQQAKIRASVAGAMVYPVLLIGVAIVVLFVMLLFVMPRFAELFESLDMPLPPTTKVMMAASDILRGYWFAVIPGAVACAIGLVFAMKSKSGRRTIDIMLLNLPQTGRMVRSFATARIARVMGVLLDSHLPLLEVLQLVKASIAHEAYRELIGKAEEAVTRGEPVSGAFADPKLVEPAFQEALRSGEQSGRVGFVLLHMADFMDEENEVRVRTIASIIEPVILIVLGLVIGVLAVSMFLPLFDMTAMTAGGG